MPDSIGFVMVGAGAVAQAYAQAFEGCEEARLIAVADLRAEAAQALAERLGCSAYASFEEMAERERFDAALVCTPPDSHAAVSIFFMERGCHVLCEKPFSTTPQSAAAMFDVARKAGVRLTMCSKFRYAEDVIRAKSIVASGILGDIILFENAFTAQVDMSARWNSRPGISGGGVLIDNGSHSVDIVRYFLGPISEVLAVEGKRAQRIDVEDTVHLFARSASGAIASIDLSWSINKQLDYFLNIYGSQGAIRVGWAESRYRQSTARDWIVLGKGYSKEQAFRRQIQNFARTLLGQEKLLITARDAIASVEVIEAAYVSLRERRWVQVRDGLGSGNCAAIMTGAPAPAAEISGAQS